MTALLKFDHTVYGIDWSQPIKNERNGHESQRSQMMLARAARAKRDLNIELRY